MEEVGEDITLANGKEYSFENLDLDVLMNLSNIQRGYKFTGVPPHDNFDLQDHSICCYFIGNKYFDYLEEKGENEILDVYPKSLTGKWGKGIRKIIKSWFAGRCFTHDLQEVVTGDLVPSFKTEEYREKEKEVKKDIEEYLGLYNRKDDEGRIKKHIKVVDIAASLWEIKKLEEKGYDSVTRIRDERLKRLEDKDIEFKDVREFYESIEVLPEGYEIE